MDSHALVSRLSTILFVWCVCFLSEQQRQQYKSILCSSRLLQLIILVMLEFIFILVLTVSTKIKDKKSQASSLYHRISATMVIVQTCDRYFRSSDWFDTL